MKFTNLDFETFLIRPAQHAPRPVCLAIDVDGRDELLHCKFDRQACVDRIARALEGVVSGAFVAFDLAVAGLAFPELWELIWESYDHLRVYDVQVAEKLGDLHDGQLVWHPHPTDPTKQIKVRYSLADIVKRRWGVDLDKNTYRLTYGTRIDTPIDQWEEGARAYPLGDLAWSRHLQVTQCNGEPAKLNDVFRQSRAQWWMHLMVCRGFMLDRARVEKLEDSIGGDMEAIAARLRAAGLVGPGGKRSTKAAMERLVAIYTQLGLEIPYTPSGKKVKLTEEVCADSKDPLLIDYARYSERVTTIAKVRALKDAARAGMPIQSNFEVLLETGRTSCSGGKAKKKDAGSNRRAFGFQLQNVKKEPGLRECFVPRPGFVLASLDYGQLELCTWAQACLKIVGESKLAIALNQGVDVHSMLGAKLFNLSYEWVKANRKHNDQAKDARQAGKPGNFGLPGGMGWRGLQRYAKTQYEVLLSDQQCKDLISYWKKLWPENEPYFEWVRRRVDNGEPIVQLFSERYRGGCGFTDGCNTIFQGLAADAAKHAGYELARACYTGSLRGAFIVDFIHDEFLFEFPANEAHDFAMEAVRIMEDTAAIWIPDVPPKVEPALMLNWSKDAGPEYDANKRLVPWMPKLKAAA